jgi:RNA polymerase sigma factor (sigma-70 family)
VKQYERLVFFVIKRLVTEHEDIEDICQEVFIKVYQNINRFMFQSRLSTWIARIAYLTAINHLKKNKKHKPGDNPAEVENYYFTKDDPEYLLTKKDASAYINYLVEQMPLQYKTLLTLYHLDEFSYKEIEEITGMPEGTIKNYLFRARKLLKQKLEIYLQNELI